MTNVRKVKKKKLGRPENASSRIDDTCGATHTHTPPKPSATRTISQWSSRAVVYSTLVNILPLAKFNVYIHDHAVFICNSEFGTFVAIRKTPVKLNMPANIKAKNILDKKL